MKIGATRRHVSSRIEPHSRDEETEVKSQIISQLKSNIEEHEIKSYDNYTCPVVVSFTGLRINLKVLYYNVQCLNSLEYIFIRFRYLYFDTHHV